MPETPGSGPRPRSGGAPRELHKYDTEFVVPTGELGACAWPERRVEYGRVERILGVVTHLGIPIDTPALPLANQISALREIEDELPEILRVSAARDPQTRAVLEKLIATIADALAESTRLGDTSEAQTAVLVTVREAIDEAGDAVVPSARHALTAAAVAAPIQTVLQWCSSCPIINVCYDRMSETSYTGIAGGTILHKGKPYRPRLERAQERREQRQLDPS